MPKTPRRMVSVSEIAEHLGVSRQRAYQITCYKSFPSPVANLHTGRVWAYDNVYAWAADHRRDWTDGGTTYKPKRVRSKTPVRRRTKPDRYCPVCGKLVPHTDFDRHVAQHPKL